MEYEYGDYMTIPGVAETFDIYYNLMKLRVDQIENERIEQMLELNRLRRRVRELEVIEKDHNAMVGVLELARLHVQKQQKKKKMTVSMDDGTANRTGKITFIMEQNGNLERKL